MQTSVNLVELVGKNFRNYRLAKGVSVYRLVRISGISYQTIKDFERGQKNITLKKIQLLCEALELDDYDLLFKK